MTIDWTLVIGLLSATVPLDGRIVPALLFRSGRVDAVTTRLQRLQPVRMVWWRKKEGVAEF